MILVVVENNKDISKSRMQLMDGQLLKLTMFVLVELIQSGFGQVIQYFTLSDYDRFELLIAGALNCKTVLSSFCQVLARSCPPSFSHF